MYQVHQVASRDVGALGVALVCFLNVSASGADQAGPYQATGFKVGEVTDTTAIVWTRLTRNAKPNRPHGKILNEDRLTAE